MSTTELFVELIVIGVGAIIWVILAILGVFGYTWIPMEQMFSIPVLIPILSFIYILGIITDRLADNFFESTWVPQIRKRHYTTAHAARDDRRLIYSRNEYLANLIEYGRSRLRISRGWAFNSFFILIASNLFIALQVTDRALQQKLFIGVNIIIFMLGVLSWYTWQSLLDTQYRRLKDDASYIRQGDREQKRRAK